MIDCLGIICSICLNIARLSIASFNTVSHFTVQSIAKVVDAWLPIVISAMSASAAAVGLLFNGFGQYYGRLISYGIAREAMFCREADSEVSAEFVISSRPRQEDRRAKPDFRTYVDLFLKYWERWDILTMVGTEPYNPPSKDKEVTRKAICERFKKKNRTKGN